MRQIAPRSLLCSVMAACFLMVACTAAPPTAFPTLTPSAQANSESSTLTAPAETQLPPTLQPTPSPVTAAATSRGPNLEATDPTSVRLDAGELQLVEFFRFT